MTDNQMIIQQYQEISFLAMYIILGILATLIWYQQWRKDKSNRKSIYYEETYLSIQYKPKSSC